MILLHRVAPFVIGLAAALGFLGLNAVWYPALTLLVAHAVVFLLFARLGQWSWRAWSFWSLVGTAWLFYLTANVFFLLVFVEFWRLLLATGVTLLLVAFAENLFAYWHAPAAYQAYALEHLSLVLNVGSAFFIAAVFFGARIFLLIPLTWLALFFFVAMFFVILQILWVSKMPMPRAVPYAGCGALLMTELMVTFSFLPTSDFANAAVLACLLYVFLSLTRAHVFDTLSPRLCRRYALMAFCLVATVLGTARWS